MAHPEQDQHDRLDENIDNTDSGDDEDVALVMARLDEEENQLEEQDDTNEEDDDDTHDDERGHTYHNAKSTLKLNYYSLSLITAVVHVIYAMRSREQFYLALLYLTSSKLSVSYNA